MAHNLLDLGIMPDVPPTTDANVPKDNTPPADGGGAAPAGDDTAGDDDHYADYQANGPRPTSSIPATH